ncbi:MULTISPECIES: hypothetical protein [Roseateles]|jgi:hypothetical protein|uniref:Uncharacterized protein n=1 Tax=Pelomonas aquatica TaxID=431058 RepID=A0ABU1ZCJ9_9BURK|nr:MULTISPECIES: hypothetical protein [Roseateles]MDR7298357.1 hypothetical protein [Pelomonas aquatica]
MPQFTSPRPMQIKALKPRNPLVAPALKRQAGRHQSATDAHAQRQQARLELRRLLRDRFPDESP